MTQQFAHTTHRQATPHHQARSAEQAAVTCGVCGGHTFNEDSPHEFAHGISDRLICAICGAHRLL